MAIPVTTGQLRTDIADMEIGDYIACGYIGANGIFNTSTSSNHWLINRVASEIPVTASNTPNGIFYFIKVDRGLLISDRVVHHSLSWDTLNTGKGIQGTPITLGTTIGNIRSLTGGIAFADENGNLSTTNKGLGAFPTNNEWDRYIVNFPTDKIQSGKTLNDVFNLVIGSTSIRNWTQDTSTVNGNTTRITRYKIDGKGLTYDTSNVSNTVVGFRPVFEYQE